MSKYLVQYKCPLCNEVFSIGNPTDIPYNELPNLCAKVIKSQQFLGNPYLYQAPLNLPHQCKDGSCGFSVFIGFKRVN